MFQVIKPDQGFESRWTLAEKQQVLAHDRAWEKVCGK